MSQAALIALLLGAAASDLRRRRIPNALSVALLLSGAAASLLDSGAPRFISSVAAFAVVFTAAFLAWRLRLCGGGDAKLASAAAAWVGISRLPVFAVATALAGGALAVGCFVMSSAGARRAIRANLVAASVLGPNALAAEGVGHGRVPVPYGVAIAAGALYAVLGAAP